ncbi:hypothetical protein FIBSPDRAFT_730025 [Athelia psychrophila]|uniref:CxC5 like cysteine cluster associated with KDZ domain-containing protein n=1 Tax=Athelia psychrophila TaxID=1759441 RepID=A0A166R2Z9_9AGAM|nr:hypothetical protein FIBSPDRAFT_730025 [Fibularhizoctonia sp. CBS 109695]
MPKNIEICSLLARMSEHEVLRGLTVTQLMAFVNHAVCLRRSIQLTQPLSEDDIAAPEFIPGSISEFLSESVGIPYQHITTCWSILKDLVWQQPTSEELSEKQEEQFVKHGWRRGITSISLYPPTNHCSQLLRRLKKAEARQVVVYTLAHGARPAYSVHLYCPGKSPSAIHPPSTNSPCRLQYQLPP